MESKWDDPSSMSLLTILTVRSSADVWPDFCLGFQLPCKKLYSRRPRRPHQEHMGRWASMVTVSQCKNRSLNWNKLDCTQKSWIDIDRSWSKCRDCWSACLFARLVFFLLRWLRWHHQLFEESTPIPGSCSSQQVLLGKDKEEWLASNVTWYCDLKHIWTWNEQTSW